MKKLICIALACIMILSMMTVSFAHEEKTPATFIYVAENGNDSASGSIKTPLKTIEAAVKLAESIDGAVVICIRGGDYQMTETINLTEAHSNLVITAYNGEDVLVTGGTVIPFSAFKPCTDEAFLNALSVKTAKDKVVSVNIKDFGATIGSMKRQGFSAAGGGKDVGYAHTLTYNDNALTIARYPNEGYLYTAEIIKSGLDGEPIEGTDRAAQIEYTVADTRLDNWSWEDVWNVAYFTHDWADTTAPAKYIKRTKTIVSSALNAWEAMSNRRVFFMNVPEELDAPGEWYLDGETGVLYMIPQEDMKPEDTLVYNSYDKDFFKLSGANKVDFIGITFNGTCASAITAENCTELVINDCEFTGIGNAAVYLKSCIGSGVENSYFHDLGSRGVYLYTCGDREKLIPSECFVSNCHFETFSQYLRTYSPAIHLFNDVGTVVSYNEIHDAPHFAIRYEGNDTIFEYNDIYDVCQDTADTGAIYTGRRWETRGCEIRYNYFHDMSKVETTTGMSKMAVYLDDCSSSTAVFGNVFFKVDSVALYGGGRNNTFENNIMVDCLGPFSFDARGTTWQDTSPNGEIYSHLMKVPYKEGVWAEKYPELVNILEDEPGVPKYNVIGNNILYQTPEFLLNDLVVKHGTIGENLEIQDTKCFEDYRNKDFTLKADSEVFEKLPEFKNIPFKEIGRFEYERYNIEDLYFDANPIAPSENPDEIKVKLNGEKIDFADVAPQIINDRTMVPLRAIFEALGATVEWDDATKTVTAVKGDITIKMTIGATEFSKNDEKVALDSPATIVDSRTLVPVRAIAESFGSTVGWIGETKTVTIED